MSQDAIVRPEDLRNFVATLNRFSEDLRSNMSNLRAALDRVGETWRDQGHEEFVQTFNQSAAALDQFLQAADEHAAYLLRKADAAQAFIDQR